ncbi:hypothetical protein QIS99_02555 [Streptomyces sp. B-S-A8]|uniref:Uncharacterized protein n=1 Tax=Streptomyces solicavernae TaxID=3043614 RepID=A0ABT6RMW6_9ACTN|nr:hypothetical protein [Streptomyces sp. B-S-A8]MDI3385103.1 hypothetical protein [Streptomyces sp. B-S-A8]
MFTGLALWLLAGAAVTGALVRLLLAALTAHAARRALSPDRTNARVRAHQRAVLRMLVEGLTATNGRRGPRR